jgi:signal transduction histidine kinase/CheY-like chemotaxis protein
MLLGLLLGLASMAAANPPPPAVPSLREPLRSLEAPQRLAFPWKFQPGDDLAWAAPSFEDSAWPWIEVPVPWGRQGFPGVAWGWYRTTIWLDESLLAAAPELNLGIAVGRVETAYELYAGGFRLGGRGDLSAVPRLEYDFPARYSVPLQAIGPDGRLVLAFRVYRDPVFGSYSGGLVGEAPSLGRREDLARRELLEGIPPLALAAVFLAGALYHLFLFHSWRKRLYLWFGMLLFDQAAFSLLTGPFRFELWNDFLAVKEAEYCARFLLPVLGIQFLWELLERPIGRLMRLYQLSHVALAVVVVLEPGLEWNVGAVSAWELWTAPLLLGATAWIVRRARKADGQARLLVIGVVALAAAFAWDIARGRHLVDGPALAPYGLLALALAMAGAIAEQMRKTQRQADELSRHLEDRVAERTAELEAARVAAEAANQAKSDFLANMSHEIRTPMAGVIGVAEILAASPLGAHERQCVETIRSSASALGQIVGEILDFSEIEAGRLEIHPVAMSPVRLVEAVAALFRPLAAKKRVALHLETAADLPAAVTSDPVRLRQVLVNVVGNAVKFTEQGRIEIRIRRQLVDARPGLRMEVEDTGIGIEAAAAEQIFQPFSQGDASARRRFGGTGLGLAISRSLLELLGGTIGFRSVPGRGSCFWFEFPAEPAAAADLEAGQEAAPAHPVHHPGSILVVEDEPIGRWIATRMLEAQGHRVVAVESGAAALEALAAETFDLVLMDCQMPGLDGYETTRQIRKREGTSRHTPVVALTAHAMQGDRERCLAAGMDDYVTKPITAGVLEGMIGRWLGRERSEAMPA